jgi:hypothetical protein
MYSIIHCGMMFHNTKIVFCDVSRGIAHLLQLETPLCLSQGQGTLGEHYLMPYFLHWPSEILKL